MKRMISLGVSLSAMMMLIVPIQAQDEINVVINGKTCTDVGCIVHAVNDIPSGHSSIVLNSDLTYDESYFPSPAIESLTIDLNGHSFYIGENGSGEYDVVYPLTVMDSSGSKGGFYAKTIKVQSDGSLDFNNIEVHGTDDRETYLIVLNNSTLHAENCVFMSGTGQSLITTGQYCYNNKIELIDCDTNSGAHGVVVYDEGNTATITGGTHTAKGIAFATADGGTLKASDATIIGLNELGNTQYAATKVQSAGDVMELTNCTIKTTDTIGIEVAYGTATLKNCNATVAESNSYYSTAYAASNGGTLNLIDSDCDSVAYGLYVYSSGGTINVNGGDYIAKEVLKEDNQAGVAEANSVINITDGTFIGTIPEEANSEAKQINIQNGQFNNDPSLFVEEGSAIASLTRDGDVINFGVGEENINEIYASARDGDILDLIKGNVKLETVNPSVILKTSGGGEFKLPEVKPDPTPTPSQQPTENNESSSGDSYDPRDKNHDGVVMCDESMGAGWVWSDEKNACVLAGVQTTSTSESNSVYQMVNTSDR